MRRTYLLSDKDLDRLFGFKLELELALPTTPQDGIRSSIDLNFGDEGHDLVIGEVFVVDNVMNGGLAGRVDLWTDEELSPEDFDPRRDSRVFPDYVNPRRNQGIRVQGHYFPALEKYLSGPGQEMALYDKIVVARSSAAPSLKYFMMGLVPEFNLRIAIDN